MSIRSRRWAAALCAATLLASCAQEPGPSAHPPASPDGPRRETGVAPSPADDSPADARASAAGRDQPPGDRSRTVAVPADRAPLGEMCRHYLRPGVPRLLVELDWEEGARPSQAAVDHLLAVAGRVADKPGGVTLAATGGEIGPGDSDRVWTAAALKETANRHRGAMSSADQVVVYVLAVRGRFQEEEVIGLAHSATEIALFPDLLHGLATDLLGGQRALERSVLVHEFGHLLCLLNISYRSALDHEDPEHRHHSRDRASVMHWAIDTSMVGQLFSGPPPDDFTAQDRQDLDGLRSGRY